MPWIFLQSDHVDQPENAIPIKPFFGDTSDTALLELIPFLLDIVDAAVDDVRTVRSFLLASLCLMIAETIQVLKQCHLKGKFVHKSVSRKF